MLTGTAADSIVRVLDNLIYVIPHESIFVPFLTLFGY